jgi:hypothetical protein
MVRLQRLQRRRAETEQVRSSTCTCPPPPPPALPPRFARASSIADEQMMADKQMARPRRCFRLRSHCDPMQNAIQASLSPLVCVKFLGAAKYSPRASHHLSKIGLRGGQRMGRRRKCRASDAATFGFDRDIIHHPEERMATGSWQVTASAGFVHTKASVVKSAMPKCTILSVRRLRLYSAFREHSLVGGPGIEKQKIRRNFWATALNPACEKAEPSDRSPAFALTRRH